MASNSVMDTKPGIGSSIKSTMTVSAVGIADGFTGDILFRARFFALAALGLALTAGRFLVVRLAAVRRVAFPRLDLLLVCALPRARDPALRPAGRFFRLATIIPPQVGIARNPITRGTAVASYSK